MSDILGGNGFGKKQCMLLMVDRRFKKIRQTVHFGYRHHITRLTRLFHKKRIVRASETLCGICTQNEQSVESFRIISLPSTTMYQYHTHLMFSRLNCLKTYSYLIQIQKKTVCFLTFDHFSRTRSS